jgi:hypothetical protein
VLLVLAWLAAGKGRWFELGLLIGKRLGPPRWHNAC